MAVKKPRNTPRLASRERARRSSPLTYDWLEHDFANDPSPLIAALNSDAPFPKNLRLVIIDLLERYRLKRKSKAKRIPSYRLRSDRSSIVFSDIIFD
jgi:hypothetical protein